jgi:rod shape determining protein RodA
LLLIWLFTDLLVFLYKEKKEARNIFIIGTLITLSAYFISRKFVVFDISWAQFGICIATIVYLIIQALRKRCSKFFLMALFTAGSLAMYYSTNYVLNDVLEPHQQTRIRVLLGLDDDANGAGYNVRQSEIAIGSGGFQGKGFLNGTQTKLKYVPEQDTDFIFCTVGEEHGFIGATIVLGLFLALILRLIKLAERQPFISGRVYGYSVLSIFLFHFFINIGMVLGLTPVIGIPLPFFSYGGSSLWGFTILLFIFLRIDAGREKFRR